MEKVIVPVMTFRELREEMRTYGICIGNDALASAIEQGVYPFASCYRVTGSKRRKFVIYRKKFEEWLTEHGVCTHDEYNAQKGTDL